MTFVFCKTSSVPNKELGLKDSENQAGGAATERRRIRPTHATLNFQVAKFSFIKQVHISPVVKIGFDLTVTAK